MRQSAPVTEESTTSLGPGPYKVVQCWSGGKKGAPWIDTLLGRYETIEEAQAAAKKAADWVRSIKQRVFWYKIVDRHGGEMYLGTPEI